ncbi:MAG: TonB-dependent receptor, partial [Pseudomonadota bacterium]
VVGTVFDEISLDQQDLIRVDPFDLQDLFNSEPTITVGSSIPMSQKLYVNGIEETNLALSIDGSRQNNKIFHHNATNLIDPALLKAVRIDPGVAPADAGPGALAGSIQFETRDPGDLLEDGENFGGFARLEYLSNGDILAPSAALFGRYEGFDGLFYLKYATGNRREDGAGDTIIGSGTNVVSGLAKGGYETEDGYRVEVSYEQVSDDESRPYRANIGRIIGGRPVPLERNYALSRQNVVLKFSDESPEGWLNPALTLAFSRSELDIEETEDLVFGSTQSFNGTLSNEILFEFGSVNTGVDFYSDEVDLSYIYLPDQSFNESGSEEAQNVGLFAQARLDVTDELAVSVGARGDINWHKGIEGTKSENSGLSGNISVEYTLADFLTLSAGFSHVWGGVILAESFIINPAWVYPVGGLEPVTAQNAFFSARAELGQVVPELEGLYLKGKIFQTKLDGARDPDYSTGPAVYRDVEASGFELGMGYNFPQGFVRVGYANIDTDIDGNPADSFTGQYLTTQIGQHIALEGAYSIEGTGVTVGADAQFVLEQTDTFDAVSGPGTPMPAYQVVNAYASFSPLSLEDLTLRLEVTNLLDADYAERATYGQEFGTEVVPLKEPGRSINLSATFRF